MQDCSVNKTVQLGLCSSCGICKNVCPKECIEYVRKNGKYVPHVNEKKCTSCGLCLRICPGLEMEFPQKSEPLEAILGSIMICVSAWSRNSELRHVSASGGVVSTLVERLLNQGAYDTAFCIDSYSYDTQLITEAVTIERMSGDWTESSLPKSRYLPVSHEKAVSYILQHRDKRVIILGTGCAIHGFRKLEKAFQVDPDRVLLIGLFCDKVFNYNVNDYFQNRFGLRKRITAIHFKNKECGGWPGDMKFFYEDGSTEYQSNKERTQIKDYFMPERCLYCIDKLNSQADISVGDNYTDEGSSTLGSNSVIIRTAQGEKAWNCVRGSLEFVACDPAKLRDAQFLDGRVKNLYFSKLKEADIKKGQGVICQLNRGVVIKEEPKEYELAWTRAKEKLQAGEVYRENPNELDHQLKLTERRRNKKDPRVIAERFCNALKRRLLF